LRRTRDAIDTLELGNDALSQGHQAGCLGVEVPTLIDRRLGRFTNVFRRWKTRLADLKAYGAGDEHSSIGDLADR